MNLKSVKILALVGLLTFGSCGDDLLDLQPFQSVDLETAIGSIGDYQAAVLGTYSGLQSSNYYGRYFVLVPDVMSDNVKQNSQANRAQLFSDYAMDATDGIAAGMWNTIYNVIARANTAINAETDLPAAVQDQKNQLVGEALALRGLAHFDLVRMFAQHYGFTPDNSHLGVPIVTVFDQNARPARNTVAEVYAQILADFNAAIPLLKIDAGTSSRISANAVKGLLSRVHLYMGNWSAAEQLATEVITSGDYTLLSNAGYANARFNANSAESIFEVAFNEVDNNGADALGRMYLVEGYGDYLPAGDLLDLIPVGDVRLDLFKEDTNLSGVYGSVRVDKYPDPNVQNSTPVVRLSEMYLTRAEARARQGNESGAIADLDMIRTRALPSAAPTTATGNDLLAAIATERRIELMFEGHRLWDLMRNKQGVVRINCTNSVCEQAYPSPKFISPIPLSEMDANENMVQNPSF